MWPEGKNGSQTFELTPVADSKPHVMMEQKPSPWRTALDFAALPSLVSGLVALIHDFFADKIRGNIETHLEATAQSASKSKELLSGALKFLERQKTIWVIGGFAGIAMGVWGYFAGKRSEERWKRE